MLRPLSFLLLLTLFSCNQQQETVVTIDSVPTANHSLRHKHLLSCMPAWNVCDRYTTEDRKRMSSFHIENDSLHIHQFESFDELLSHDEEYTSDLYIIVPMSLVLKGKPICIDADSAHAVCSWQCNNNWNRELVFNRFTGYIHIWYRSEWDLKNMIMFDEDITFSRVLNPTYKQAVRYKTFDFADYGKHDICNLPVRDSTKRHVWR